ncbi:hypothetical protein ACFQ6U_34320 [Streptomyces sp. NPDC056465]|uniref:hypothetical protein n=1 Tax=Streptomyces sp. NPDC056465 TaxID=3345829 RepID=UPI0036893B21
MAAMTGASGRTDRRRSGMGLSAVLGWALMLVTVLLCCAPAAAAAAPAGTPSGSAVRTFTPVPGAVAPVVVADAPDEHGAGSSCHGATDHSTAVVLPGNPAPAALPGPSAALRTTPLTGGAAIRGPSVDGVGAVDRLRLQVQRI